MKAHGGRRAAARHLKIKRSYLSALMDGTKKNPGDWYLRKLGLRRVTYIEEICQAAFLQSGRSYDQYSSELWVR